MMETLHHPQYGTGATPSIPIFLNVPPSGAEYEGAGAKVKVPNGTDWFDELFEQAEVTDIAVSASGGSGKVDTIYQLIIKSWRFMIHTE